MNHETEQLKARVHNLELLVMAMFTLLLDGAGPEQARQVMNQFFDAQRALGGLPADSTEFVDAPKRPAIFIN